MTTRELIEHLSKLPQDLEVQLLLDGYPYAIDGIPTQDIEYNCNYICAE